MSILPLFLLPASIGLAAASVVIHPGAFQIGSLVTVVCLFVAVLGMFLRGRR